MDATAQLCRPNDFSLTVAKQYSTGRLRIESQQIAQYPPLELVRLKFTAFP